MSYYTQRTKYTRDTKLFFFFARWLNSDDQYYYINNIDVRQIMKEYFARNRIKLIHELENRDEHYLDGVQTLTYTVEKNKIKIGWYSRKNIAPIFSNETRKYVINTEYHQVAELEGIPAEGINKIYAFECPTK